MTNRLHALYLCVLLVIGLPATAAELLGHGRFPRVLLYRPTGPVQQFVILLSGRAGWNDEATRYAEMLVGQQAMVAGIDAPSMTVEFNKDEGECVLPVGDLENLSHFVQGYAELPVYFAPVLLGVGSSASLAYAMLAQAPAGTFTGAISSDFCPILPLRKPLCEGEGVKLAPLLPGKHPRLSPTTTLHAPWFSITGRLAGHCPVQGLEGFLAQARRTTSAATAPLDALRETYQQLLVNSPVHRAEPSASLAGLPVIEVPATAPAAGPVFAVLLSGDGGWAGIDNAVADALAAQGVPVVGFDSLRYFWRKRTPEGLAADLDKLIQHYRATWQKPQVLLVGYSQGADVLPFAVNRLPATTRAQLAHTVLIGVGTQAAFEFHLEDWVGADDEGLAIAPEIERLEAGNTLCLYGKEDDESICPQVGSQHAEILALPGGHHFDGDYAAVANAILASAKRSH